MKKEEKKEYQKPELVEYGNLKEVTKGGGNDLSEPDDT